MFALFAVLILCLLIGILIGGRKEEGESVLLRPYRYEKEALAEAAPVTYTPTAFAASLAVIPDESVYYDASISTGAALIVNRSTREVLHSESAFRQMAPASTTKLMTMLIALKYGNLDDTVTVAEEAIRLLAGTGSSVAGLHVGDRIHMRDLLYALMLPSGNDAANAIAFHISGSIEAFADLMNQTARELGATGSHFQNPHGLDEDGHYMTAYDLYLILNELLSYDEFLTVVGTPSYTATYLDANGTTVSATWGTSNGYLNGGAAAPAGVTVLGGKTGTTTNAMFCLTLTSRDQKGDLYISVVLKSDSRPRLYENMTKLLIKIPN